MTASPARKRRSSNEVRALITSAAYEEFARTGLDGTSIRSVAERAGVTESMIFRHFTTKDELFRATAAGPLVRFMYEFASTIATRPEDDPRDVTFRFVSGLYDLCMSNRQILVSLSARVPGESTGSVDEPVFEACLDALVRGVERYVEIGRSNATGEVRSSVRLALALILGATLSANNLFPRDTDESEIKRMLCDFVLYGAGYIPHHEA
ncbi:TetR/AcrR family transcriptional regulator [Rhodococcus sp. B50]|uniref:TetR/AcrR family transcriptional regulator n=1 Tax=Rhodococcus sp. B50 TaxID=2682847 RepID=UPI001BD3849F|nr:TetR/AcrR family transcriptional regulator [Rhodococcus sp. B50]MBS9376586.1 HTH-type transcriptional repressor [Rhodococcus sp. B50]